MTAIILPIIRERTNGKQEQLFSTGKIAALFFCPQAEGSDYPHSPGKGGMPSKGRL